ncbi:MAG: GSCFA domain-containing protein [Chitinophagales bacterium]
MFRTEFSIDPLTGKIDYSSSLFFIGSCFSEHIAGKCGELKFNMLSNPFGIMFNPVSISTELRRHMSGIWVNDDELFNSAGIYRSFDFHGRCMHPDKEEALRLMNDAIRAGKIFLGKTSHLIITFGTSLVYQLNDSGRVVANNHKLPGELFTKVQLQPQQIIDDWSALIFDLKNKFPGIQIIFTISPVRHLRDGAVENLLSKSVLVTSVHTLRAAFDDVYYFPAYEIMMDDLRDYRFYEKDMIHPNEIAIDYIWNKFKDFCIDNKCTEIIREIESINNAMEHRPFFAETEEHKLFLSNMFERVQLIKKENPNLDLENELNYFSGGVK